MYLNWYDICSDVSWKSQVFHVFILRSGNNSWYFFLVIPAGGQAPLEAYPFGSEQYGGQDFAQRPSEPEKEYQPHEPKVGWL